MGSYQRMVCWQGKDCVVRKACWLHSALQARIALRQPKDVDDSNRERWQCSIAAALDAVSADQAGSQGWKRSLPGLGCRPQPSEEVHRMRQIVDPLSLRFVVAALDDLQPPDCLQNRSQQVEPTCGPTNLWVQTKQNRMADLR